jgi:aminodeoxyfutalosine deaminase
MLIHADWICPMNAPPLRNAAMRIRHGKVVEVGNELTISKDSEEKSFPGCAILPGLINAHTHLELSLHPRPAAPNDFVDWLIALMSVPPTDVSEAVKIGVNQSLKSGVTTVGDITKFCTETRAALAGGPLRVMSFGEVLAMAQRRNLLEERLATAVTPLEIALEFLTVAVSPHAPYSVESHGYRRCVETAIARQMPIASHIAETPGEATFLANHTGPFKRLWDFLNRFDDHVPTFQGGPIRFAKAVGLLDVPSLLVHVNYCDDEELAILANGKASVVYCPRTHEYFGHPPHRWRDMRRAGVNVAIGTDSVASSGDLNMLADLRLLRQIAPDEPAFALWQMVTTNAAAALGMASKVGALAPGKSADFCVFPATGDDPMESLLRTDDLPSAVFIAGQPALG